MPRCRSGVGLGSGLNTDFISWSDIHFLTSEMNNTDIPPEILDKKVDDDLIDEIAYKYLPDWQTLRSRLGFSYAQELNILRSFPNEYARQRRSFLYEWKEINGGNATYRVLIDAAEAARNKNLADNIKSLLRERLKVPPSPPPTGISELCNTHR